MIIRPFRSIYLITLAVIAYSYFGPGALLIIFLASCDLEIKANG